MRSSSGFRYRLYPELRLFPQAPQATNAQRELVFRLLIQPKFWLVFVGLLALLALATPSAQPLLDPWTRGQLWFLVPVVLGPMQVFGFAFAFQWVWRGPMRRQLRRQLLALGVPVCRECGYDLRGQTEARCPECGTPFGPHLRRLAAARRAAP